MWMLGADEICTRGSRSSRMGQRSSPSGSPACSLSSPITPSRSWYIRVMDLEALCRKDEHCGATICQVAMLFLGLAIFTSTIIILRAVGNDRAVCFVPGAISNIWESSQLPGIVPLKEAQSEAADQEAGLTSNDKAWLLKQVAENGTTRCGNLTTKQAFVFGFELPSRGRPIRLETNHLHQILVVSYTEDGIRRCSGGDFYETDLSEALPMPHLLDLHSISRTKNVIKVRNNDRCFLTLGANWKYRPPVKDLGDGSYLVNLRVDNRMADVYTLKVVLLFSNLHGLDHWPEEWVQAREVIHLQLEFVDLSSSYPSKFSPAAVTKSKLELCTPKDFELGAWHGRWTRAKENESCVADLEGRFRCLDPNEPCQEPWCEGRLGSLESNGWVYSAHCAFRIFTQTEAWSCLDGRWLFFWGDSNHQDTIRNLLNFVLGRHESDLGRTFDSSFSNPQNSSQVLKVTSYFNGHYEESGNNLGLNSLSNSEYRNAIQSYFLPSSLVVPDTVILNSGLHDGKSWPTLNLFAEGAHNAAKFWGGIWKRLSLYDESRRPKMLFRTTVAPAGESRRMPANPHKMEVFNTILGEDLLSTFGQESLNIIDAYDMTFPWHFDNMCSDGGHYGRPPSLNSWQGITTGHQYFVDVMIAHVLLNAVCPL